MKLIGLMLKNALRNRRRTALSAAGIGLAVFVVTAVTAVQQGFGALASEGNQSVLNVYEKDVACALGSRVFDTYLGGIRSISAVESATGVLKGIYTYQRRENLIPVEGVEYEAFRSIGDIRVRDGSEAAFLAAGNGALIGHRLAERYNWRVGETVAMVEGPTVVVAGILSSPNAAYEREILLHKSYLEGLMRDDGESTYLAVKVANAGAVAPVSRSIDTMFANHPRPTKTQSEKSTREQQARDYDAIRFMLSGMVLATLLACLFGAANSVSMSARERTREVGILRSLGFRRMHVLALLTGESTFIAVFGGLIGIGASWLLLASEKMLGGIVPVTVTPLTVAIGVGMAILVGLLGAIVPAVAATRVKIVDTLRFVD